MRSSITRSTSTSTARIPPRSAAGHGGTNRHPATWNPRKAIISTGGSKRPYEISHLRESVEVEVFCAEESALTSLSGSLRPLWRLGDRLPKLTCLKYVTES